MMKNKLLFLSLLIWILPVISLAAFPTISALRDAPAKYPFYAGLTVGYGTTTWSELVSADESLIMLLSTPTAVDEGGTIGGAFIGYEVFPSFDVELSYTHYPNARVFVDPISYVTYDYGINGSFVTRTNSYAFVGKFLVPLPHAKARVFSSIGPAVIHRQDAIYDHWLTTATFNLGFDVDLSDRVMLEVGGNYTAGTGVSELDPIVDYIPFLYSGFMRLAWRF